MTHRDLNVNENAQFKENNDDCVVFWGTGSPTRELMYVDDLSDAIIFLMKQLQSMPINVGTSREITIRTYLQDQKYRRF